MKREKIDTKTEIWLCLFSFPTHRDGTGDLIICPMLCYSNVTTGLRQCCAGRLARIPVQSVLNAAARSIAGLPRSDHITDTLASFHWLKAPERIQYKLATVVYRSLNGTAPSYLAADLWRLSDMPSRRRLRSSLTHQLDVRLQSQCATVGDRTFATAGARLCNSLPADIVSCDTLPHFRRELKTFLFRKSYPSILF